MNEDLKTFADIIRAELAEIEDETIKKLADALAADDPATGGGVGKAMDAKLVAEAKKKYDTILANLEVIDPSIPVPQTP